MYGSSYVGGGINLNQSSSDKRATRRAENRSSRQQKLQLLSVAACAIAGLMSKSAIAASGSWTGAVDANWSDANWTASPVPGIGDTATFDGAGGLYTTINLGGGINVSNIAFSSSPAAYTIGSGAVGSQTLTLNGSGGILMNPTVANNELFNAAIVLGTTTSAANFSITNNSLSNTLTFASNISGEALAGNGSTGTLTVGGSGNTVIGGSLLLGSQSNTSNVALTKIGTGTLTFNGTTNAAVIGYVPSGGALGTVTVNSGALVLDYSNFSAVGNANLLNSFTPVSMGGGTLQVIGNATNASTQSFNNGSGVTVNPGMNVISVGPSGGNLSNPLPTLNLGAFTQNVGSMTVFNGPAYNSSASGATTAVTVPATGTITTTTLGNQNNLLWPAARSAVATVGLYNWASVLATGTGAHNVLSGDQVTGFYTQVANGGTAANADLNYDLLGNATFNNAKPAYVDTIRFNVQGAYSATTGIGGSGYVFLIGGILVTPNVGANNSTLANGGEYMASAYTSAGNCPIDVYQNNTAGELLINVPFYYYSATSRATCFVQGGAGTVNLTGQGTNDGNYGSTYLNGGTTIISDNSQLGRTATNATLFLNGGTALGSLNGLSLGTRAVTLGGNGGGLAAFTGTTMTLGGVIGGAVGTGQLVIGIPASAANGNTAGLVPGTGTGTANAANYAGGTVVLNGAGNAYNGGTTILGGATLNINSEWQLGGSVHTGITFNNGTLQYNTTLASGTAVNTEGYYQDISANSATPQAAVPVNFLGNAIIDTNGHAITYANTIGNGGSGSLTVKSAATGGALTLASPNTYTGGTTVVSGTLNVNNTTGSGTGPGPVTVSGGALGGSGFITGAVNVSGGAIAPGAPGTTLTLSTLTFNSGNLNFSVNGTADTASLISATSATFNAAPTLGALSVTAGTGLSNGEVFTVLTSPSTISGNSFLNGLPNQTSGRFVFTPSVINGGKSLILTASGYVANLIWQGGISGLGTANAPAGDTFTWNDKQTSGASNFFNGNASVNGYDYFYDMDNVTFGDTVVSPGTGSLTRFINVASNVSPGLVTVSTAGAYTFSGIGSITGSGNVLVSSGTLNLQNASNSYSGGTNISSGATLTTSVANILPVIGNFTVAGTLDLSSFNQSIGGLTSTGVVRSTGGAATLTTNAVGSQLFSGSLQNGTGTLALTVNGTGTQILTGISNTYTGGTTINAGATLQIGNNTSTISLPVGQAVTDNGNLAFNLSAGSSAPTNSISGTGTVTQSGAAGNVLQLSANTYSGGTLINSGTIQLTGATGLGTGDVTIASGAKLDLNSNNTSTGALNGGGLIDSTTGTGATAMALSIGNNNNGGTFSGSINNSNGVVSLTKAGTGTQVLSGANNYTGSTTLSGGTLSITGNLGTSGTPTGAIYVNTATLAISGNVFAPSLSTYNTAGFSGANLTAGSVTLSGNLGVNQNTNGAAYSGLVSLTGGTLTANSVTIDRSSSNYGNTVQLIGSTGTGLYVNGATLAIATTLTFGDLGPRSLSSADMRIDSGSVTVGGTTTITDNNTRLSLLDVNGGTFTSNDMTGPGVQVGGVYATGYGELLISGTGILNTNKITLGDANQTAGLNILEMIGGTAYIGSGGIVAGTGTSTNTVNAGNTTVATAPTIAASGNWSTSLPITLNKSSAGLNPIFQAANALGGAENITLNGLVSGSGGLTKTGKGYLSLAGTTTYLGATNVSAGTLVDVNNSVIVSSSSININGNMIIQGGASPQAISTAVAQAFNGGAWNGSGTGIISSSAAASDITHLHTLGVIQNDNGAGNGTQLYSTFEGYSSLNDSDVLIKYTYYGDTDLNGKVDGSDYSRIDNAYLYNQTASSLLTGWFNGDFNYDGVIDGSDYTLIDNAFNSQGVQISSQLAGPGAVATAQIAGAGASAVPEPTSLGLLGISAAGLLGRRRRRN